MAALDFPSSPTIGQVYTANGKSWQWDGTAWISYNRIISIGVTGSSMTIYGSPVNFPDATSLVFTNSISVSCPSVSFSGNTTLGDASADTLTINGTAVSAPNGLNVNSNQLVLSSGNVGIGTSSPGYKLDVVGQTQTNPSTGVASFIAKNTGGSAAIELIDGAATPNRWWLLSGLGTTTDGVFSIFDRRQNVSRLAIDTSGKVGINVTPSGATAAKLQVTGDTTNATTLATSYSAASTVIVPKSTSGYSLAVGSGTGDFPYLQISANGAASGDLLIQPYGGNVGIGTSSPTEKLTIASSTATATYTRFQNTLGSGLIGVGGANTLEIANTSSGVIDFYTSAAKRMTLTAAGNLGIGTSSPYCQLDVYSGIASPTTGEATGVGTIRITNGASALSSAGGLEFKNAGDTNGYGAKIQSLNSGGPQLVFANRSGAAAWTERMRIDSSGQCIWKPNGTTSAMTLTAAGNLLVGTTSATSQFVKFQAASNVCLGIANATFTAGSITLNAINDANTANIPLDIRCSQFYITSGVSAGAGTSTLKFQASGAVTYDTSSERYKDNIRDSLYGLSDVLALRSAMFEYKADGRTDVGLIAEEVLPVIPELVSLNKDGLPESVAYDRFVSVLVKSIQELHAEIESLKAKVN